MAQAVLNLYPGTEFAVGPSIDDGFYYDFLFKENIKESDLMKIENEMRRINKSRQDFIRKEISKDEAQKMFSNQSFKQELINSADKSEGVSKEIYLFIQMINLAIYVEAHMFKILV